MMRRIMSAFACLVLLSCVAIAVEAARIQNEDEEKIAADIRRVHSFEWFTNRLRTSMRAKQLATRENYDRYIAILTDVYNDSFTAAEVARLADCLGTPEAQRFMRDDPTSKALGQLLAEAPAAIAPTKGAVVLAFDRVSMLELVPFLMEWLGKGVAVHPDVGRYEMTLFSKEPIARAEALERILDKMAVDGLELVDTKDALIIRRGGERDP